MTSIKLIVKGANARAEVDGCLTAGMVGIPVTIEYDSSWAGLTKNMVCKSRAGSRMVLGVENAATVPHEVMSGNYGMYYTGNLYIGIEGRNAEGTLVIPTIWADCGTIRPGVNSNADPSTGPTLPVWAQLQADVEQLKENGVTDEQIAEAVDDYFEKNPGSDSSQEVPDYWKAALDTGVKAINTTLCNAGRNKSAFLFYTDAHWTDNVQVSPVLLKYLYEHTGMAKTVFGGDIVHTEVADYDTMKYLWDWRQAIKCLPNHHSVPGNHDDGNSTNNLFPEQYVYGYLLAAEETPNIVRGETGMYYYIDEPSEKTRYLYLDTGYQDLYSLSTAQSAFIQAALESTPSGWHIVVISHVWYVPDYNQYTVRPVPLTGLSVPAKSVAALLDNYNAARTDGDAKVEFCIGGHIHYDYIGKTDGGIPIICCESDSKQWRGNFSTNTGDPCTMAAVSGVVANYTDQTVSVIRVGRGNSFTVDLTSDESTEIPDDGGDTGEDTPTYTNVLDTAGYQVGYRVNSSGAVVERSDRCVTGLIDVTLGDTLYFKNVVTQNSDYGCNIAMYDSSQTFISGKSFTIPIDASYATWYDDGTLKSCTINIENCEYVRFCFVAIDDTSIITVNEPIE